VRDYEDPRALFAGADGLDAYKAIVALAPGLVREGGLVALEVGDGQAAALESLVEAGFPGVKAVICRDLRRQPRGLILDLAARENNHCNTQPSG
jgi:release factor glutamine methyltransferase